MHIITIFLVLLSIAIHCSQAFTSSSKRKATSTCLPYSNDSDGITTSGGYQLGKAIQTKPNWVPMELVELASEDLHITHEEFISTYADIEAYTSCDDEGDDFHECDFMNNYLGPTRWIHLTANAQKEIDDIHFKIWKDVWEYPHEAVDVADKVSKECLRYYKEFMIKPRTTSVKCPTDRPLVRVKVIPASFGLEGFEDGIWAATEDLLGVTTSNEEAKRTSDDVEDDYCKAITFVVAAPDLTDPILVEDSMPRLSPQAEFEQTTFEKFSSSLREKLTMYSRVEGVVPLLNDMIDLKPYHPLWKDDGRFPYPCVAVSTKVG